MKVTRLVRNRITSIYVKITIVVPKFPKVYTMSMNNNRHTFPFALLNLIEQSRSC